MTAVESSTPISLEVTRQGSGVGEVTVRYRALGTSYGQDTLSWPAGDMSPRRIEIPALNDGLRNPDRILEAVLFDATGGAALRNPPRARVTLVDDDAPRESRLSSQQVACDAERALGFLQRTDATTAGGQESLLAIWLTPTGDLAGLATARAAGQPERQVAFSSNLQESTLLRNPERPQLFSVSLTRNELNSDLVSAGSSGRILVTLNPTLDSAPATGLLSIDNVAGAAGRLTDAKPGRGLSSLAERCHQIASPRDAHLFAVLAKTVRPAVTGAARYEMAILRGEEVGSYFLDIYPYSSSGLPLGRLAASLDSLATGTGALEQGTLRLLPRCAAGQTTSHCTTLSAAGTVALVPPAAPGEVSRAATVQVTTSGSQEAGFAWASLLSGSTWASAPPQAPPPLKLRDFGSLECDRQRLRDFLDRVTVSVPNSGKPASVNLTFSESGDFAGIAYTANGPTPEHQLAFSTNPEEMSLLRNPGRPQLDAVSLTRNALASDLVAGNDPDRLSIFVNPTLSASPEPSARLAIDNVQGAAGLAASARPGRGLDPILERCHSGILNQEAHTLQLLSRILRVEAEGAPQVKTAISGRGDTYTVTAYPFAADGTSMGRISLRVTAYFDSTTGELGAGELRVNPPCSGEECTTFHGPASVEIVPPMGASGVREPITFQLPGLQGDIFSIDFASVLAASTWRKPLAATGRSLGEQIALGGTVLFVGAHPGDEVLAAPLLGEVCSVRGAHCTFLVATRGGNGVCKRPGGCAPDLATVRTQEMERTAALFGAELIQWDLPDATGMYYQDVELRWGRHFPGGFAELDNRLSSAVAAVHPTAVVTFDRRHGSTCNPDHGAVESLLTRVEANVVPNADFYWLESLLPPNPNLAAGFSPAVRDDPGVETVNAAPFWSFLLEDAAVHTSQFSVTDLLAFGAVPNASRVIPILQADNASAESFTDGRYYSLCDLGGPLFP